MNLLPENVTSDGCLNSHQGQDLTNELGQRSYSAAALPVGFKYLMIDSFLTFRLLALLINQFTASRLQ